MKIVDDSLSDDIYSILKEMMQSGLFLDRVLKKASPTAYQKKASEYLTMIFNGSFHTLLPKHVLGKRPQFLLDPLIGDWKAIKKSVMDSLPTSFDYSCRVNEYFYNPERESSRFYMRVQPQHAKDDELARAQYPELRKRVLPDDVCRCSNMFCSKYDLCLRSNPAVGPYTSYSSFLPGPDGCAYFIGE